MVPSDFFFVPPPCAMGCNRNRPDINTTTVGGRGGGTGGLCIPVVTAPSRRATRGGGGLGNGHP